ncbi:MAG: DUF1246 domain-containing protein [Halobacteria archaeon]
MPPRKSIQSIAAGYKSPSIAIFGSHSALETGLAAKTAGFKTILIAEKGRDALYTLHNRHLFDEVILLKQFKEGLREEVQQKLRDADALLLPNRSMVAYWGLDAIENRLKVPLYGSRSLLRAEERTAKRSQYWFLERAKVRTPKRFSSPSRIDRPVMVKVQQKRNPRERAFFVATSPDDFRAEAQRRVKQGLISREGLRKAVIEEYVVGPLLNANFHAYALKDLFGDLDLVGFSDREQANESGFRALPAPVQAGLEARGFPRVNEEVAHRGKTLRESKHEMVYGAAERLLRVFAKEAPPGLIGPLGLQGALGLDRRGGVEFVVFDLSLRVPGDPAIGPTSPALHGVGSLSIKHRKILGGLRRPFGERRISAPLDLAMMELEVAHREGRLAEVVT